MSPDQLRALLVAPEDALLERKPGSVNSQELRQTLVAFANSVPDGREAVLLIGLSDDGKVQGVEKPDGMQKLVRLICERVCYPPIKHQIEVLTEQDKAIVAVVIPPSTQRPHFSGPAYMRQGSESVAANEKAYEELIASRHDKCRVLLGWRNNVVSVLEDGYRLDQQRAVPNWRSLRECWVRTCDAHMVRLQDIGTGNNLTVSLTQVVLGYDEERYRNQLTVRP
jgi:predicted HTH transcriptional regulator